MFFMFLILDIKHVFIFFIFTSVFFLHLRVHRDGIPSLWYGLVQFAKKCCRVLSCAAKWGLRRR